MSVVTSEFLICGGGVVGLTTAFFLAGRGHRVTVLDRTQAGQEASWAGAGMLPPGHQPNAANPEVRLRSYSHQLWPDFLQQLRDKSGFDSGYLPCGAVQFPQSTHETSSLLRQWNDEGVEAWHITGAELSDRIGSTSSEWMHGVWVPAFSQVRNPRHLKALKAACRQLGVVLAENEPDARLIMNGDTIAEVQTAAHRYLFDRICITAGAWSASLLQQLGLSVPVKPIRGQIVQLQLPELPFRCVLEVGRRYLVPRADGLILAGSTEEDVGFVKANTAAGISSLLEFACSLVPSLSQAVMVRAWSGLRPASPDELPLLGAVPGTTNLIIGTGHFRSGLQMSPATGTILADLLCANQPAITLEGLSADRFLSTGFDLSGKRRQGI